MQGQEIQLSSLRQGSHSLPPALALLLWSTSGSRQPTLPRRKQNRAARAEGTLPDRQVQNISEYNSYIK